MPKRIDATHSDEQAARIQELATARKWSLSQTVGELCEVGLAWLSLPSSIVEIHERLKKVDWAEPVMQFVRPTVNDKDVAFVTGMTHGPAAVVAPFPYTSPSFYMNTDDNAALVVEDVEEEPYEPGPGDFKAYIGPSGEVTALNGPFAGKPCEQLSNGTWQEKKP